MMAQCESVQFVSVPNSDWVDFKVLYWFEVKEKLL